jgi:hypothetical protein
MWIADVESDDIKAAVVSQYSGNYAQKEIIPCFIY